MGVTLVGGRCQEEHTPNDNRCLSFKMEEAIQDLNKFKII